MNSTKEISESNAKTLKNEIDALASGHWDMFKRQHKEFWEHAKAISIMFKEIKIIDKQDREKLWEKYSSICEEVKRKQISENEKRSRISKDHYDEIMSKIARARPCTLFGFSPPDIEEMKCLGAFLREAGALLSKYKSEMFGEHKQECFDDIQKMRVIHDAWWEQLKKEKGKKHDDFINRVKANIERNQDRHRKAVYALESCRRSADDLRDKISSAYNDDWRDKAYVWLSELEDKIRDIEKSVEEIENWIREDENKLHR